MRVQLRSKCRLIDILRIQFTGDRLPGQLARGFRDFHPRAVIERHYQGQADIALQPLGRTFQSLSQIRPELAVVADQTQPDTFLRKRVQFAFELIAEEPFEIGYFLVRPTPVFRRKGV